MMASACSRDFLAALRQRNAQASASDALVESYGSLLAAHTRLERQHAELRQTATSLAQERAELARDVALLHANELNLGVSSAHIEQLQEKVAALQDDLAALARDKADALRTAARETEAASSARDALDAADERRQAAVDEAHGARGAAASARAQLSEQAARLATLAAENESLVARLLARATAQAESHDAQRDLAERFADARRQLEALAPSGGGQEAVPRALRFVLPAHGAADATCLAFSRRVGARPADLGGQRRAAARADAEACDADGAGGQLLLTGAVDGVARLVESAQGQPRALLKGGQAALTAVDLCARGERALGASADGVVRVWALGSGKQLAALPAHSAGRAAVGCEDAAFAPDGRAVVSAGLDGALRWWDLARAGCARAAACESACHALALGLDGALVATAHADGRVRLWDARADGAADDGARALGSAHAQAASSVALSRDGRQVLSASLDHTLRLTDLRTGRAVHTLRDGGYACAPGRARACLSPRDDCAAAGAADGRVLVWGELDTASARLLATLAPPHAAGAAASVAWSDDGELVASAHADGSCCVWQR